MAIQQPISTDYLNSPDHSLSHRVIANDNAAPAEAIVVDSAGNVGIGTVSPGAKLEVNGNSILHNNLDLGIIGSADIKSRALSLQGISSSVGESSGRLFFAENNNGTSLINKYGFSIGYNGDGASSILTDSLGNDIDTLTLIGNGQWGMFGHNNNATGTIIMYGDRAGSYVNFSDTDLYTTGNVGIGTVSPTALLHVNQTGTTGNTGYFYRNLAAASTDSPLVFMEQDNAGDDQDVLNIQNDGSGAGIRIDNNGTTYGIIADQADGSTRNALHIAGYSPSAGIHDYDGYLVAFRNNDTVGGGLYLTNNGTNQGLFIDQNGNGTALHIDNDGSSYGLIVDGGNVGIGTTAPTGVLHIKAGTASANTAPLKFTPGVLNTTPVVGCMEFVDDDTDGHLYITLNIGGVVTRKEIAFVA